MTEKGQEEYFRPARSSNEQLPCQQGARRRRDQQLQQEPRRREAEKPGDKYEQDHVAESDHPRRTLRHIIRHERLIDGGGNKADDDRENVADGDQGQFLRIAHVHLSAAAKIAIRSKAVMEMISAQTSYGARLARAA